MKNLRLFVNRYGISVTVTFIVTLYVIVLIGCENVKKQEASGIDQKINSSPAKSCTETAAGRLGNDKIDFSWPVKYDIRDTLINQCERLMWNCMTGNLVTIQKMMNDGADSECRDSSGRTLLMVAARFGHEQVVGYLCSLGVDVRATRTVNLGTSSAYYPYNDIEGGTALAECAINGDTACARILLEHGAQIDQVSPMKCKPLFYAAQEGNSEMVRFLLKRNADVNDANYFSETALSAAVRRDKTAIVDLLIQESQKKINSSTIVGALFAAIDSSNECMVKRLLKGGITYDTLFEHMGYPVFTPLMYAAYLNRMEIAALLIGYGADVNYPRYFRYTALSAAISNGHVEMARFLLKQGADMKVPGDRADNPLSIAIGKNDTAMVKLLLSQNVDKNLVRNFLGYRNSIWSCKPAMFELLLPVWAASMNVDIHSDSFLIIANENLRQKRNFLCSSVEHVGILLENGVKLNPDSLGYTKLMVHASRGNTDSMLADMGEDNPRNMMREIYINQSFPLCGSALYHAANAERFEAVKLLIRNRAEPLFNLRCTSCGRVQPLNIAIYNRNREMATYFSELGGRSAYEEGYVPAPEELAMSKISFEANPASVISRLPPILAFVLLGWDDLFYKEVITIDSNANRTILYQSAFLLSIILNRKDVAENLLTRNPELMTEFFTTPEIILEQSGVTEKFPGEYSYGAVAFQYAAQYGLLDMLKFLVKNTRPSCSWKDIVPGALLRAERYGRRKEADFLLKHYYFDGIER
jgi:ankyrin repeat protein